MSTPSTSRKVGHYRILKEIGRGAQGQVFLAEDERLSRKVALKVLSSTFAPSPATLRRFQREAEAASRLDHPGICPVHEAGEADGVQYIAMRYLEGQTLARQIQTTKAPAPLAGSETVLVDEPTPEPGLAAAPETPGDGAGRARSSPAVRASSRITREEIIRVVYLIERAARAVHAAHEAGLIHRDIKPGNIMVTKEGEPVILDFGLARDEESDLQTLTHSGDLLGTPAYMSPEQLLAQRIQLDRRTDVYSLGVTLFECLTLERPFDAPTRESLYQKILTAPVPDPTRINRQIPRDLKVVLETAMEKDRDRRYKTALDFAEDLRHVRSYEPIHARPAGPILRFRRWTQRNPVLATSTLGLFLLLTTGLGISLFLLQKLDRERRQTLTEATEKDAALLEKAAALKELQLESDAKAKALLDRQEALKRAEGLRLTAQASSTVDQDPGLALLLALEAAERGAGPVLNAVIVEALREQREERVFQAPNGEGGMSLFSRDGSRVLMAAWGGSGGARVYDTATGRLLSILRGPSESFDVAAFSPDGELLITATSWGPEARVWSTATGEQIRVLGGHRYPINSISFRGDGERAVTASQDGTARVWDVRTGRTVTALKGSECGLSSAAYSADGKRILTASAGLTYTIVYNPSGSTRQHSRSTFPGATTARLWDADTGEPLQVFRGHSGRVVAALSPDGRILVTSSEYGGRSGIRIWDAATGQKLLVLNAPGGAGAFVLFSPDSTRLVTVENDSFVRVSAFGGFRGRSTPAFLARVWDVTTGKQLSVLEGHANAIRSASFSQDGERIVTASEDVTARIWRTSTGTLLAALKGHEAGLLSAAFSPDGFHVFTSGADRTARVWNADTTRELAVVPLELGETVRFTVLSPDGKRVFTAQADGGTIWDAETGLRLASMGRPAAGSGWLSKLGLGGASPARLFDRASFSLDGTRLLTQTADRFDVWGGDGWKLLAGWKRRDLTPDSSLSCAAFSPDGSTVMSTQLVEAPSSIVPNLIAAAAKGRALAVPFEAVLWEASTGKVLRALRGHDDVITSASFSADGRRAVTRSQDSTAIVWDTSTGALVSRADRSQAGIASIVISPDGTRLAATTWSLDARVLDAVTGAQTATLSGHASNIESVIYSPDSQRVLTAAADHTARVWDASSGEQLLLLEGHRAPLRGASYSPDGRQVVTWAEDQTVRVWDSSTGRELIILPHGEGVQSAEFTRDGTRIVTVSMRNVPRIWPLDLVEEARRRKARDLTPRERDRYEIGTPDERKAARRAAELKDVLLELEVVVATSSADGDEALRATSLDGVLSRLEQVFSGQPARVELTRTQGALLGAVTKTRRRNAALLGALARVQALDGRPRDAVLTLEEAVMLPDAPKSLSASLESQRVTLLPDLASYGSIDAALDGHETLIPAGAEWRFFRGRTEPSPGMEWTECAFNDAAWEKGPSGFGYGDNDDATILSDMQQSYTTVYIRRAFDTDTISHFASLTLSLLVDDGCVAYLNGVEVGRSLAGNPGDRIPFDGVADKEAVEPLVPIEIQIDPKLLRSNGNVLAVQGINRSKRSSDLSLLPVLSAELQPDPREDSKRFETFHSRASDGDAPNRIAYLDARILQRAGRHADAAAAFTTLCEADPARPEPVLRLAECLRVAGNPKSSAARLEEALSGPMRSSHVLWDLWFQVKLVDLKSQVAQLLARWPGGAAGSSSSGEGREAGDDLRWLLEQLSATGAVRIHCGGADYTSASGTIWGRDRFYVGGASNRGTYKAPIEKTDDDPIYQTHRSFPQDSGFAGYRIRLPPGRYEVALHFAEVSSQTPRLRTFGIRIEGKTLLENYDIAKEAGFNTADVRTFETNVDDGALEIDFTRGASNPEISGIEVRRK